MAPWQNHEGAIPVQRSHSGTLLVNLHRWQQLCSAMLNSLENLPLTQLCIAMKISKPRSHCGTLFNFSSKNCTTMAPWLKNQGSHCGTHNWEGGSHCGTQEPFWYSLFLEEVLTSRSIFGTLRGNWWHFLVLYTSPVYPLSVWCFGEVEKSFFLGITEMLSCNAMAPALSGGHCDTYCNCTFCN